MSSKQKSTALYTTPFSRAYWRDATAELKDVKMLVFAALMIALRLVMKLVAIPLAPGLKINTAFLVNALGAMVYGPVMAGLCAAVTDVLGYLMNPEGVYFLPFILTEIAGSMIFALLLYRTRVTTGRVMLSRFCICFFVNIVIQTPIYMWYYALFMGGKHYALTLPGILKNLMMFPIESAVLTLFLRVMLPITSRLGLTYAGDGKENLRFSARQVVALVLLFVLGAGCAAGYVSYYYDHTSLSASYTKDEREEKNRMMQTLALPHLTQEDGLDGDHLLTVVESASQKFLGQEVTYEVALYRVADGVELTGDMWRYSKSPAAKDENLTRIGTATIVVNKKTGEEISFRMQEAQ